jgi:hypothetical protein
MAGATLTTVADILKDLYLPPVTEQLNNEILFLQRLEPRDQELVGNQAVVPLHVTRSGGIGARGEDVDLPTAGNQGYDRAVYDLKYLYGRVRVTGPSMAKTSTEAGAFLQVLKGELDGIRQDLKQDLSRQFYGDGSAQIAQCDTTSSSTTVVLNATSGAEAIRKGFLHRGMVIDIGTTADYDTIAAARTITAVNVSTPSITIDGAAVTTSSSHYITRSGNAVSSSTIYETAGLQQIVATAANTFGSIDASSVTEWDNLRTNVNGSLALDNLTQAFNIVTIAGGDVSLMVSTFGLQRSLFNLLQAQVRYVEPMSIKGGFSAIEYMGKPFIADRHHPFGKIHLLDEKYLKVYTNRDWHFLDEDGDVLKWVTGRDAWEAVLARYLNLGTNRRNTQLVLYNLTDSTGY